MTFVAPSLQRNNFISFNDKFFCDICSLLGETVVHRPFYHSHIDAVDIDLCCNHFAKRNLFNFDIFYKPLISDYSVSVYEEKKKEWNCVLCNTDLSVYHRWYTLDAPVVKKRWYVCENCYAPFSDNPEGVHDIIFDLIPKDGDIVEVNGCVVDITGFEKSREKYVLEMPQLNEGEAEDEITQARFEAYMKLIPRIVSTYPRFYKLGSLFAFRPFTDIQHITDTQMKVMMLIECNPGSHRIAAAMIDECGRVNIEVLFNTHHEYEEEKKLAKDQSMKWVINYVSR